MSGAARPSKWKLPLIFFGSLLGLALLFQLAESLLPARPAAERAVAGAGVSALDADAAIATDDPDADREAEMQGPIRPTLTRTDRKTIEIGLGFMRRSRYVFEGTDGTGQADAFHTCLEKGFDETFALPEWNPPDPGPSDRSALRRRMKSVVRDIADRCMEASPEPAGD